MNLKINSTLMKSQTFGVEIEMGKLHRSVAIPALAKFFDDKYGVGTQVWRQSSHDGYCCYGKPDANGNPRVWKGVADASSRGRWGSIQCELVTPILTYDDLPELQEIVRLMRSLGGRSGANWNAGVHIHVGANFDEVGGLNAESTRKLVNLIASHERLICDAINTSPSRSNWFRFVEPSFLADVNRVRPTTKEGLERLWYGYCGFHDHYDSTRYHLLNLHAIWDKGTVEFRCFEFHNNLHAGELKAWVQLCLAMVSYAKLIKRSSARPIDDEGNPKYAMKTWLINMGLIGPEFATCRKMLTKNLAGDAGSKTPRATTAYDDADVRTDDASMLGMALNDDDVITTAGVDRGR